MELVSCEMENIITKIFHTLFQQITNGVTLIFAIGTLIACFFILLKRRHHGSFYLHFWLLLLFMIIWRMIVGIISNRYALLLVVPAVMLTAFTGLRGESCWQLLRRKYTFLPRWFAKFISRAVLLGTSAGALLMAHHALTGNQDVYAETFNTIDEYKTRLPGLVLMTDSDEFARTKYYTNAPTVLFKSAAPKHILQQLRSPALRNKNVLIILRSAEAADLAIKPKDLPPGKKLQLCKNITPKGRRKGVKLFLYSSVTPSQAPKKAKK